MTLDRLIAHLRQAEEEAKRYAAAESYGLARVRARDAFWLRAMIEHHLDHRALEVA